jgi:hypothetical protein
MPTKTVEQTQQCPYCLLPTVVVTVEQLLSTRGEVVASTIIDKASCTNADWIGSRITPR